MNKKVANKAAEPKKKEVDTFTKVSIISSLRFADYKDILTAILDDKKKYSISEVNDLLDKFMKGKVD